MEEAIVNYDKAIEIDSNKKAYIGKYKLKIIIYISIIKLVYL